MTLIPYVVWAFFYAHALAIHEVTPIYTMEPSYDVVMPHYLHRHNVSLAGIRGETIYLPTANITNSSTTLYVFHGLEETSMIDFAITLARPVLNCSFHPNHSYPYNLSMTYITADGDSSSYTIVGAGVHSMGALFDLLSFSFLCRKVWVGLSAKAVPPLAPYPILFAINSRPSGPFPPASTCFFDVAVTVHPRAAYIRQTNILIGIVVAFLVAVAAGTVAFIVRFSRNGSLAMPQHDEGVYFLFVLPAWTILTAIVTPYVAVRAALKRAATETPTIDVIRPGQRTPARYRTRRSRGASPGGAAGALDEEAPAATPHPHATGAPSGPPSAAAAAAATEMTASPLTSAALARAAAAGDKLPPAPVHAAGAAGGPRLHPSGDLGGDADGDGHSDSTASDDVPTCRICRCSKDDTDEALCAPCDCTGSSRWVHPSCLAVWRDQGARNGRPELMNSCEVCGAALRVPHAGPSAWTRAQWKVARRPLAVVLCVPLVLAGIGYMLNNVLWCVTCTAPFSEHAIAQWIAYSHELLFHGFTYYLVVIVHIGVIRRAWSVVTLHIAVTRQWVGHLAQCVAFAALLAVEVIAGRAAFRIAYAHAALMVHDNDARYLLGAAAVFFVLSVLGLSAMGILHITDRLMRPAFPADDAPPAFDFDGPHAQHDADRDGPPLGPPGGDVVVPAWPDDLPPAPRVIAPMWPPARAAPPTIIPAIVAGNGAPAGAAAGAGGAPAAATPTASTAARPLHTPPPPPPPGADSVSVDQRAPLQVLHPAGAAPLVPPPPPSPRPAASVRPLSSGYVTSLTSPTPSSPRQVEDPPHVGVGGGEARPGGFV